ncbi:MAG: NAD-dependent dihydropyrimidine dehydrogenase subunit PreA [Anaerolineae bacterium]|nr:NAD-dependent dihydropyrimidine dehydrogenase subunit PreA [Anaerolineae bacterium]
MANLETTFTGIHFPNPFLVSSSPSTTNAHMIKKAFRAGWGGVVLKTVGLEPTPNPSPRMQVVKDGRDKRGLVNIELISDLTALQWVDELKSIRDEFPERPLIASIMGGGRAEDWQEVVHLLEPHGVNAFEMNVSCPNFAHGGRGSQLGQDPESLALAIGWVRQATSLPLWVKLTPNVADVTPLAQVAKEMGADAVVATNTLSGMAGVDLECFAPLPTVGGIGIFGGYSGPGLKAVALRCAASIGRAVDIPLAGCGGISKWRDAAEYMTVGASLVQVCTAVMWNGYEIIAKLTKGLNDYLDQHDLATVNDLVGKALPQLKNYPDIDLNIKLLAYVDPNKCNGCGLCVRACDAGGFEALFIQDKKAVVDVLVCDGCGLCIGMCPTDGISMVAKAAP